MTPSEARERLSTLMSARSDYWLAYEIAIGVIEDIERLPVDEQAEIKPIARAIADRNSRKMDALEPEIMALQKVVSADDERLLKEERMAARHGWAAQLVKDKKELGIV